MGKALGIDYGVKRTGLAITDELQIIASPLEGLPTAELEQRLLKLVASENITDIVVGDPDFFRDGDSHSAGVIDGFCNWLATTFPLTQLHRVDEAYSSREAMAAMVSGGMRKSQRRDKTQLDRVSAAVILQRWLQNR
jgi:putative Holliday junction resolvase